MSLTHEMHRLPPIAGWLSYAIVRSLEPLGWTLESRRGGYNSHVLRKGDVEYHFRSYPPFETIQVRRRAQGPLVDQLESRVDVVRFVQELEQQ